MYNIKVMQLNANDESCKLVEWYFNDGDIVKEGDTLVCIETSKASKDIECESTGILHILAQEGEELEIGALMGCVFENEEEKTTYLENKNNNQIQELEIKITKPAEELMLKEGISEKQVLELGKKVILKTDIEKLIGEKSNTANKSEVQISKHQQMVAKVVSASHREVPSAALLMKVYYDKLSLAIQDFNREQSQQIGVTELIIKILSELHPNFPLFFGRIKDEKTLIKSQEPNIGITMDLGKGLFIPVIKLEQTGSLQEIGDVMMDFKIKALRNNFKEEELTDGNISITLNTDRDIIAVLPIIPYGQTCMIAINAVQEELYKSTEGKVESRSFFNIGISYDHRVINGFEAVQFIKTIKNKLENVLIEELTQQLV